MSYEVIFDFLSNRNLSDLESYFDKLDWIPGRQETGYLKAFVPVADNGVFQELVAKSLAALKVPETTACDCYILKYPPDSLIPPHKDDAPFDSEHWRLNAIIKSTLGGKLYIKDRNVELWTGDAVIFRPDIMEHKVSRVYDGTRYVWSVGILK